MTSSETSSPILRVDEGRIKIWQRDACDAGRVIIRPSTAPVVTAPPYPAVAQPEPDYVTFPDPKDFNAAPDILEQVWKVCFDLLEDLGRLVVNLYDIPTGES